jgi:hypothetical protein
MVMLKYRGLLNEFPTISLRHRSDDVNLICEVELANDLSHWLPNNVSEVSRSDNGDGTETVTLRSLFTLADGPEQYLRVRVTLAGGEPLP